MSRFWYYAEGDETRGPVAFDQLIQILSRVTDAREVLIWSDGFEDWKPAKSVVLVAERLFRPPPLRRPGGSVSNSVPSSEFEQVSGKIRSLAPVVTQRNLSYEPKIEVTESIDDPIGDYQQQFSKVKKDLTGKGGWLALLGFLLIMGLLRVFADSIGGILELVRADVAQKLPTVFWLFLIYQIAYVVVVIYVVVLFLSDSHKFPQIFKALLVFIVFAPFLEFALISIALGGQSATNAFGPKEWGQVLGGVVNAAIWIPYLARSKRVANTFVK